MTTEKTTITDVDREWWHDSKVYVVATMDGYAYLEGSASEVVPQLLVTDEEAQDNE